MSSSSSSSSSPSPPSCFIYNNISAMIMMCFIIMVLLCGLDFSIAGRVIPPSGPSTLVRPLLTDEDVMIFNKQRPVYHAREVKGCLPKGFRHASAPSRFVNFHALDNRCSHTSGFHSKKP